MKINWKAIPDAMKLLGKVVENNKSTILVGAGLLGWVGTAVLAANATPKAKTAIDKAKRDMYQNYEGEDMSEVALTPMETVKATWQYYIPAVGTGLVSSAAIIYAHKIDLSKIVSLTTSYQLSKGELKKLKDKIVEKDGDKKLKEYEHDICQDELKGASKAPIYNTGFGETIFKFGPTNMLFYSDRFHVENSLKELIMDTRDIGVGQMSDLMYSLGLPKCDLASDREFYPESFTDIDPYVKDIRPLLSYCALDPEHGDNRACAVIDFGENRIFVRGIDDDEGPFHRFRR